MAGGARGGQCCLGPSVKYSHSSAVPVMPATAVSALGVRSHGHSGSSALNCLRCLGQKPLPPPGALVLSCKRERLEERVSQALPAISSCEAQARSSPGSTSRPRPAPQGPAGAPQITEWQQPQL